MKDIPVNKKYYYSSIVLILVSEFGITNAWKPNSIDWVWLILLNIGGIYVSYYQINSKSKKKK
ncbi:MAG: hypothetical protein WCP00_00795 [bacterium]